MASCFQVWSFEECRLLDHNSILSQLDFGRSLVSDVEPFICHVAVMYVGHRFAPSAKILQLVGQVLLESKSEPQNKLKRLLWAKDGFENARKETTQSIQDVIDSAATPIETLLQKSENVTVANLEGEGDLSQWVKTFRTLQVPVPAIHAVLGMAMDYIGNQMWVFC